MQKYHNAKNHTHVHEGRAEDIPDRVAALQHFLCSDALTGFNLDRLSP